MAHFALPTSLEPPLRLHDGTEDLTTCCQQATQGLGVRNASYWLKVTSYSQVNLKVNKKLTSPQNTSYASLGLGAGPQALDPCMTSFTTLITDTNSTTYANFFSSNLRNLPSLSPSLPSSSSFPSLVHSIHSIF